MTTMQAQLGSSLIIIIMICMGPLYAGAIKFGTPDTGEEKCYRHASDVIFAIDSSHSIREAEFDTQLAFLKHLVDTFTIGKNHIQVGVVSFGSKVRLDIRLDQFVSKSKLKKAVGRIQHMSGGTYTHEAIRFIRSQVFQPKNGGRPWAKKKLVLITDGLSSNTNATLLEASAAREEGVEIFGVGVGEHAGDLEMELELVATEPKSQHVFSVKDFQSLKTINNMLSDAACERPADDRKSTPDKKAKILEECKTNAAEVVFVLDSSSSIWGPYFDKQIKFVKDVTSTFDISPDKTRVGLVIYSDSASVLISLEDTQTKWHVHRTLESVEPIRGNTNTAHAINTVRTQVLSSKNSRPGVSRIVVILTDGQSDDPAGTLEEARAAHEEGIHIFAIGIGRLTDARDLMAMASDPDDKFVFHVDDFDDLTSVQELLVMKSCDVSSESDRMQKDGNAAKCSDRPNDVVFVYDAEWLSRRQNSFIVTTISDVIESEVLNTKELRFGVIRAASHDGQLHDIKLTDNWNNLAFKTKLDEDSKKSLIYKLLKKARNQYFHGSGNEHRKRTVVVFLDSDMTDWFQANKQAYWLDRSNVQIIVVGLGKHFDKLQALSLTDYQNLITTSLHDDAKDSTHVGKGIIDRLCE